MELIVHYGQRSDKFLRDFENRRADYALQKIAELPLEDLKVLRYIIEKENRTFVTPSKVAV